MRDFFDTPEPPSAPSKASEKEEAPQPQDTRPCQGCQAFTLNGDGGDVPRGFGRCSEITHTRSIYVSPSFPCRFTPSRFKERP